MEIIKVYKQELPAVQLIGKRFTHSDRDASGTFGHHWQRCFAEAWPDTLMQCKGIAGVSEDLFGAMRMTDGDADFEYWIGSLLAPDATVPDGFESVAIPAGVLGVCWLQGDEKSGELFGMEAWDLCTAAMTEKGWKSEESGWFMERYNCPRFTTPDENSKVILDICAYLI